MSITDLEPAPVATEPRPPRVSVICPFLNAERFIEETIASVLAQDYRDFELLLVDDGSTDKSSCMARTCAAREPQRIRYLEHPGHKNRGTTVSRNLALSEARGELVAFIDADDCWRPSKLREQVELLDRIPELDAVFGAANYWASYAGGRDEIVQAGHVRNRPVPRPQALLKVYPLGRGTAPCLDLLIRRATVEAIGGFEEEFVGPLFLYEDQAFLMKLYLHGTVYFSDRIWLYYRQHDRSCTAIGVREGLGRQGRQYCLDWFEEYLGATRFKYDPRIRLALILAQRPYRHPHLTRVGRLAKGWIRQMRALRDRRDREALTRSANCR